MNTNTEIQQAIRDDRPSGLSTQPRNAISGELQRRVGRAQPSGVEDARKLCQAGA